MEFPNKIRRIFGTNPERDYRARIPKYRVPYFWLKLVQILVRPMGVHLRGGRSPSLPR